MSPALSDLPVRKVIRALESIGFAYEKRGTPSSILRQADLTPAEFLKLLN